MRPVNTALLSFGMSGKVFHAPFLQVMPQFHFYGVWERSKSTAKILYPNIKTFRTLEELLLDEKVDLVIVNTPNYTHYDYAKTALLAGKHVIVEKPFTVTVAEGAELILLAKKQGKMLSVYHNRRYDSDYKIVKKIVTEGWLGSVVEAEFHFDRFKKELSPKTHKEKPGPGTGALYDLGSHLIDQALQLFGKPSAIFADLQIIRPASEVDDFFELLLYYSGKRVRLRCSYLVREALPAYIIHGTKGSFLKSKSDVQETALQAGKMPADSDWGTEPAGQEGLLHTEKNGEIVRKYLGAEKGDYSEYYRLVFESLRKGAQPGVSAEEGLDVIGIIEAAIKSNKEKRVIEL